ncbi:TIGR03936 family radical SAM-associated protein [Allobranchiibius sp. GilTou73]|uniref:TIGR03936 family radical SAM-associated protein n=1 Tax=Allobranchiibius sp. GilTou73 TaxID=2904523 RepID=UPI001F2E001D|nr:TIGR03936 family radical SAM-associated protein [Allobranchiibius sp. GilTou73]UIJ34406.1 TIGR03936 family radical SAM-associated protein [Allobranchiibius sp. GilTou73]
MPPRQRVPEGPAPDPAVQKLRIQYAKRGRLRFSSTRDFQRALERALRRASVPMAFSAGFHPHPRISYANAAPTGTASEAEYFEIQLREHRDPAVLHRDLDEALPDGLDVVVVREAATGALADLLEASDWVLDFADVDVATLAAATDRLLASDRIEVTRMMKRGPRTFDVREAVLHAQAGPADGPPYASRLGLRLRHLTPAVRPDDVLSALVEVADLRPARPPLVTRSRQGPLRPDGTVADPLAATTDEVRAPD